MRDSLVLSIFHALSLFYSTRGNCGMRGSDACSSSGKCKRLNGETSERPNISSVRTNLCTSLRSKGTNLLHSTQKIARTFSICGIVSPLRVLSRRSDRVRDQRLWRESDHCSQSASPPSKSARKTRNRLQTTTFPNTPGERRSVTSQQQLWLLVVAIYQQARVELHR